MLGGIEEGSCVHAADPSEEDPAEAREGQGDQRAVVCAHRIGFEEVDGADRKGDVRERRDYGGERQRFRPGRHVGGEEGVVQEEVRDCGEDEAGGAESEAGLVDYGEVGS